MYSTQGTNEKMVLLKYLVVGGRLDDGVKDLSYPIEVCLDPIRNEREFGHDRPVISFGAAPVGRRGVDVITQRWCLWGWAGHPGAIPQLSATAMPAAKWG